MSVTFEENESRIYSKSRCFNFSCRNNMNTKAHNIDNGCGHTENTGKCKNFKGEKPKIKYEIIKPFSIIDIFEKKPCHDQFLQLLKEPRRMGKKFSAFHDIEVSPTMMKNLGWLKEKGFLIEKDNRELKRLVDRSWCRDMNLKRYGGDDPPHPSSNKHVYLVETGLKVPNPDRPGSNYGDSNYYDIIIESAETGKKFFTFSHCLR